MAKVYGIYGASGFGKEILPLVREFADQERIVYIDDGDLIRKPNEVEVLTFDEFVSLHYVEKLVTIAIANAEVRENLARKCEAQNIALFDVQAKNTVRMDNVTIDKGFILCPFVTLTSDIKVGKCFHANIYSYIAHDCIIGDYVTFAPAVKCNGNVTIEDNVYIGTGVIIHQGKPNRPLTIGKGAVIAAGAVVTKSVPAQTKVFGNPAIEFTKENIKRRR